MKDVCIKDIAEFTGGKILIGDEECEIVNFATDSNKISAGEMFVPIIGARVDGHKFMKSAIQNGACATFTSNEEYGAELIAAMKAGELKTCPVVCVKDTVSALQAVARAYEKRLKAYKVGITGSVGKTTTKEMVATAISGGLKVYRTAGNFNSQVGVPITIMNIDTAHEAAVIEMGMSMEGEMQKLATLLSLDSVIITNIGVSHIEQLGSQQGILNEKWHITDALKKEGKIFLNYDDVLLRERADSLKENPLYADRIVTFGRSEGADYQAVDCGLWEQGVCFTLKARIDGNVVEKPVSLSVLGDHNVGNALASIAVAYDAGVSIDCAVQALLEYKGVAMRQQIFKKDEVTFIDDSYNASPDSMKAGLSVLRSTRSNRKIAVLADMLELGPDSDKYHGQVGEYVADAGTDLLITFGEMAKYIEKNASLRGISCLHFESREDIISYLKNELKCGDAVLIKGSRGMELNKICDAFRG